MSVGINVCSRKSILYPVARLFLSGLAKCLLRVTVVDAGHVPLRGPVVIAANHTSYFDIPLLGMALPRPASYWAKRELFGFPVIGALLRALGGIPIRRGEADRLAMDEGVRRLSVGEVLVIYPEGTRTQTGALGPAQPGIGRVVAQTGAPVIPVFIDGTFRLRPFRKVTIRFGAPMTFEALLAQKEQMRSRRLYATIAESVMVEIGKLHAR